MSAAQPVLFGGISVYLQQHLAIFRHTPWLLDRLWDAPAVIRRFASGSIQVDPRMLGALTVSTLRGESGYQRKEVDKLVHYLAGEPRPDVVNLPNSMLIALAAPIRRALDRPIVVTLQGDDLFLDGLVEPYKSQSLELIRQQVRDVDVFVSVSEYYSGYMAGYLRHSARPDPHGAARDQRQRLRPSCPARAARRSPSAISPASRRRRDSHNLAEAYRILRQERGLPPVTADRRRLHGRRPAVVSRGDRAAVSASWGLPTSSSIRGTVDRDDEGPLPGVARRPVGAQRLSRTEGPLSARGDGHGRAGRAAQSRRVSRDAGRRPAAACCRRANSRPTSPTP